MADDRDEPQMEEDFDVSQCLFCNQIQVDLNANVEHMAKAHGLFIPEQDRLTVDLDTFVSYLQLVIFGYFECLSCGVQKRSREAAQSHMIDKGHCRFDIMAQDSEFRDFYDFGKDQEDSHGEEQEIGKEVGGGEEEGEAFSAGQDGIGQTKAGRPSHGGSLNYVDQSHVRLASGKVVGSRSHGTGPTHQTERHRALHHPTSTSRPSLLVDSAGADADAGSSKALAAPESTAVARDNKRRVAVANQLSHLCADDRRSLMHLPAHQQLSILSTQKKQTSKGRRSEMWLRGRLESKGNKTLMKHFVSDVPGRQNG
ncbi:c2h2 finger domain-containing protein [Hypoxylon fuscum]|nr:c2h2 finger domain-containing protein [Hypoxylon fuscum]